MIKAIENDLREGKQLSQDRAYLLLLERNAQLKRRLDRLGWVCCGVAILVLLYLAWMGK